MKADDIPTRTMSEPETERDDNIITAPSSTDVLCGRGAPIIKHTGNKIFRAVVKFNKPLHDQCNKNERYYLAESIVKVLEDQTPPTRFLKKAQDCGISSDEKWVIISKDHAIRKTLQALREKETCGEATSEDDLLDIVSGRYHDKTKFLGQDEDWNNVIQHLLPPPNAFLLSNEDECPSPSKRQKTNQSPTSLSTIRIYDETDNDKHFDQDSKQIFDHNSTPKPFVSSRAAVVAHTLTNKVCSEQITTNDLNKTVEYSLSAIDVISVESEDLNEKRYIDFDAYIELEQLDENINRAEGCQLFDTESVCCNIKQQPNNNGVDGSYRLIEGRSCLDSFCCSPVAEFCYFETQEQILRQFP